MHITVSPDRVIDLHFTEFNLEYDANCKYDSLQVMLCKKFFVVVATKMMLDEMRSIAFTFTLLTTPVCKLDLK